MVNAICPAVKSDQLNKCPSQYPIPPLTLSPSGSSEWISLSLLLINNKHQWENSRWVQVIKSKPLMGYLNLLFILTWVKFTLSSLHFSIREYYHLRLIHTSKRKKRNSKRESIEEFSKREKRKVQSNRECATFLPTRVLELEEYSLDALSLLSVFKVKAHQ